jgi:hypothetical protein
MRFRSGVAAVLTVTTLTLGSPVVRADETAQPQAQSSAPGLTPDRARGWTPIVVPDVLDMAGTLALRTSQDLEGARARRPVPSSAIEDIRLSHGAKTAIIVTAIVVGVLLLVGVIAVNGPGHLH